jgi:hypothetical protein
VFRKLVTKSLEISARVWSDPAPVAFGAGVGVSARRSLSVAISVGLTDCAACEAAANPPASPLTKCVVAAPRTDALMTVANAQAKNPWAVSRKKTSWVWMSVHFVRSREARYPPTVEAITPTITRPRRALRFGWLPRCCSGPLRQVWRRWKAVNCGTERGTIGS